MLAGAWGTEAAGPLERMSESRGAPIYRAGGLRDARSPHLVVGNWYCWLFGEPEDGGTLAARFGHKPGDALPAAFKTAVAELGEAACELLCGRFVIVACDRERERCVVVRDQLGAQPLVYTQVADGTLFAEHERDLLELLPRTPVPDRLALLQWIENGIIPTGHTLYEGMRRLPAGHRLIHEGRHAGVERWWDLRYGEIDEKSDVAAGRAPAGRGLRRD